MTRLVKAPAETFAAHFYINPCAPSEKQSMSGDLTLLPDDLAELDVLLTACRRNVLFALDHENPGYSQELYRERLHVQRERVTVAFTTRTCTKHRETFAELFRNFVEFVVENSVLWDDMEDMLVPVKREIYCVTEFINEIMHEFDETTGQADEQRIFLKYLTGDATRFEIAAMLNTMNFLYERARYVIAFSSAHPRCKENIAYAQLEISKLRPRFMLPGETDPDDEVTTYSHATNLRRTQFLSQQPAYEEYNPEEFEMFMRQFLEQYPVVLQRHRNMEARKAFSMASNTRLGSSSHVSLLENSVIAMILRMVVDCESAPTADTAFTRTMPHIPRIIPTTPPHTPNISFIPLPPAFPPFMPAAVAAGADADDSDSD